MNHLIKTGILALSAFLFFSFLPTSETTWLTNIDQAKAEAQKSERIILMSFQGSDWCASCKRLEKKLFSSEPFAKFAADQLVLLKVDFPMRKENRLSKEQTAHNESLADQFNPDGQFPKIVILDAEMNSLGTMGYDPAKSVEEYISTIQQMING